MSVLRAAAFLIDQQLEARDVSDRPEIIKYFVTEKLHPHTQGSMCRKQTLIHNWKHSVMKSKD